MQKKPGTSPAPPVRHGVARVISKLGLCSRTQAAQWVMAGRVRVNGRLVRDPEFPVRQGLDKVELDDAKPLAQERIVLMLNKPRALVTTARDERERATVYDCFAGADLPWIAPIGRLDKASEGLLLFSNDPHWAAQLSAPGTGPDKVYHVQVDCVPDEALLSAVAAGTVVDGQHLGVKSVSLLRHGDKHAWLEIVLDEGKNRQIRRVLEAFNVSVLRLVRVAIGGLSLGDLPKGKWRRLSEQEIAALIR